MTIKSPIKPVILSAASPDALIQLGETVLEQLESEQAETHYQRLLEDSERLEIPQTDARLGFVADSMEETKALLALGIQTLSKKIEETVWSLRKGVHYRKHGIGEGKKVVAMFPGQGSQYLRMLDESKNLQSLHQAREIIDPLFEKDGLEALSDIIWPESTDDKALVKEQDAKLTLTQHAQPSIGMVSVGLFKLLQAMELQIDATVGHSFGELTALWAAKVFSDEDYFFLAKARGKAMASPDDPDFDAGGMLAVRGDVDQIIEDVKSIPDVTVANLNSRNQVVLAGAKQAVQNAEAPLVEKGYKVTPLHVSAAFHSVLVKHAQEPFAKAVRSVKVHPPQMPVYSNTTGQLYPEDPEAMRPILEQHILNSVLFKTEIENNYERGGYVFIEFGPKNVLTSLVANILEGKPHEVVALNASAKKGSERQWRDGVMQLRLMGIALKPDV